MPTAEAQRSGRLHAVGTGSMIPGRSAIGSPVGYAGYDVEPGDPVELASAEAIAVSRGVATCASRKRPDLVKGFLDATAARQSTDGALRRLNPTLASCLVRVHDSAGGVQMRWGGTLAFALNANAYMRRTGIPTVEASPSAALYDDQRFQGMRPGASKTALCLAVTQPARVAALLVTEPSSEAERSAFGAVIPHLVSCVDEGAKATLSRPVLRLELARHYYMLSAKAGGSADPEVAN